jgi:hypothetical protein
MLREQVRALGEQLVGEKELRTQLAKTTEQKDMLEQWGGLCLSPYPSPPAFLCFTNVLYGHTNVLYKTKKRARCCKTYLYN